MYVLHQNEPGHDKTYNKTCVTSRLGSDCTSTQYGKDSGLSFWIAWRLKKADAISKDPAQMHKLI